MLKLHGGTRICPQPDYQGTDGGQNMGKYKQIWENTVTKRKKKQIP